MLRIVATVLVLALATGIAAEACGPGAGTPSPTPSFTIADPSQKPRTPSATIEVPPPID